MSRRLGALTLILLTALAILVGTAHLSGKLGKSSTVPTILQPSPGCAVGCWHGIHIGKTTISEAEAILHESHFTVSVNSYWHELTWTESSGTITQGVIYPVYDNSAKWCDEVDRIYLTLNDDSLSLADAILLWGTPIGTTAQFCSYPSRSNGYFTIFFEGDVQVRVDPSKQLNNVSLSPSALTPNTVITEIGYVSKNNSYFPPQLQSWKGFIQFPPDYLISDFCG